MLEYSTANCVCIFILQSASECGLPRRLLQRGNPGIGGEHTIPLSAYSPEWVALQIGTSVGAEVRFIDLTFSARVLVDNSARLSGRVALLLAEQWFQRSAYLRNLANSMGCRDVDELWDRLFESWARDLSTESFVSHVATYCELARHEVTDHEHERDGTTAREAEMATAHCTGKAECSRQHHSRHNGRLPHHRPSSPCRR